MAPVTEDETFDQFCERLGVSADELPHAFAAYLHQQIGWGGASRQVSADSGGRDQQRPRSGRRRAGRRNRH